MRMQVCVFYGMQVLQEASPQTDAMVLSPRTMADALQDVIRVCHRRSLGCCGRTLSCSSPVFSSGVSFWFFSYAHTIRTLQCACLCCIRYPE